MLDKETLIALFDATMKSLVFNLDFIPADKLEWKPAPTSKSALEIANHLAEFLGDVSGCLDSGEPRPVSATTIAEAKQMLIEASERFILALRLAPPAILEEKFREDRPFTTGWIATAAILDTIHHHGQIAYIQTLLGDTEIHFDSSSLANFVIG